MKTNKILPRPISFLLTLLLGTLLGSCASTPPADLKDKVRVFNVYREQRQDLPEKVEGCEYLGKVYASTPSTAASAGTITLGSADPEPLLEIIRSRAYRKGADTVFVSLARMPLEDNLRATAFRCGETEIPKDLGLPID